MLRKIGHLADAASAVGNKRRRSAEPSCLTTDISEKYQGVSVRRVWSHVAAGAARRRSVAGRRLEVLQISRQDITRRPPHNRNTCSNGESRILEGKEGLAGWN